MLIVIFNHKSYGKMSTTAENWINYETFDATCEEDREEQKIGESYPVNRYDCSNQWSKEI